MASDSGPFMFIFITLTPFYPPLPQGFEERGKFVLIRGTLSLLNTLFILIQVLNFEGGDKCLADCHFSTSYLSAVSYLVELFNFHLPL